MKKTLQNTPPLVILLSLLLLLYMCLEAMPSFADNTTTTLDKNSGIIKIFCNVINAITGPIGKVIAVLIIASLAISLFLGKVTWGLAIATMAGMGLLFGATSLVDVISSGVDNNASSKAESLCSGGDGGGGN